MPSIFKWSSFNIVKFSMSFVLIFFPQHDILKSQNHLQLSRYLGIFGCSLALFTRPGRAHAKQEVSSRRCTRQQRRTMPRSANCCSQPGLRWIPGIDVTGRRRCTWPRALSRCGGCGGVGGVGRRHWTGDGHENVKMKLILIPGRECFLRK